MKFLHYLMMFCLVATLGLGATSCRTKYGCPANESLRYTNSKGEIKRPKRASHGLFPKKMNKRRY